MSLTHHVIPASNLWLRINKIALFTDFSKDADAALEYAAILARAYEASITLAHAYVPPTAALATPEISISFTA